MGWDTAPPPTPATVAYVYIYIERERDVCSKKYTHARAVILGSCYRVGAITNMFSQQGCRLGLFKGRIGIIEVLG